MNMLIGLLVGVAFFMSTIKAYTLGIKHGKQLINKEVPKIEPLKEIIQHFEAKKEEKHIESATEEYWR